MIYKQFVRSILKDAKHRKKRRSGTHYIFIGTSTVALAASTIDEEAAWRLAAYRLGYV